MVKSLTLGIIANLRLGRRLTMKILDGLCYNRKKGCVGRRIRVASAEELPMWFRLGDLDHIEWLKVHDSILRLKIGI